MVGQVEARLVRDLEHAIAAGALVDSRIGAVVMGKVRQETRLCLADGYDESWIAAGIRLSDEYFVRVAQEQGFGTGREIFHRSRHPPSSASLDHCSGPLIPRRS